MGVRASTKTVTFLHPFTLEGLDPQPAGDYVVDTDEELVEGISFPVYRRVSTQIHLHASAQNAGRMEIATVDPISLQRALSLDAQAPDSSLPDPGSRNSEAPAAPSLDTLLLKAWGRKRP